MNPEFIPSALHRPSPARDLPDHGPNITRRCRLLRPIVTFWCLGTQYDHLHYYVLYIFLNNLFFDKSTMIKLLENLLEKQLFKELGMNKYR